MIFLGSKKRHAIFWTLILIFALFTKFEMLSNLRLGFDSIFSGLLALTGFIFTARSFITIKLNDVIYGNEEYRKYIFDLKKEGAYKYGLYDPLKNIDSNLANATSMCLYATVLFVIVAFIPELETITLINKELFEYPFQIFSSKSDLLTLVKATSLTVAYKVVTDTALVYFVFCLYQMVLATKSLHKNMNSIIAHWEEEYANWQIKQVDFKIKNEGQ